MDIEEIVEVTPGGDASELARQLLAVAADPSNRYRVEDVKTTTAGPMGLAFLLPVGLYEAWQASLGVAVPPETPETGKKSTRRKAANGAEE